MAEIDYSQLHQSLTAQKIINALLRDGFERRKSASGHHTFLHTDGRRVTVSYHRSGQTFKRGTLKSMIETQAQWTRDDLRRLKLLK